MISSIRGTVVSIRGSLVVVEVGTAASGVGYALNITPRHALELRIGAEARILTTLIVREDSQTLYGFPDDDQLTIFELLLGVTGVGPKSALGVLEALDPDEIARAIAADDDAVFRKVSGIGPKTAKLIVLSLAGKVAVAPRAASAAGQRSLDVGESVVTALVGLGWPERTATQTVDEIVRDTAQEIEHSVPSLLRLALARLGPAARS